MRDGTFERFSANGAFGTRTSRALYARVLAGEPVAAVTGFEASPMRALSAWQATRRYLPSLLRASLVTIVLSCLSMVLAVVLGDCHRHAAASTAVG